MNMRKDVPARSSVESWSSERKDSWKLMPDLAREFRRPHGAWLPWWRAIYALRRVWRRIRVTRAFTRWLGPQYRRSRDLIEIDITYRCNLHCINCNRSVTQAPEDMHMSVSMIRDFVDDSITREIRWRRIRVLGGEPTLHPHFAEIMNELSRYRAWHQAAIVEVVTNGHSSRVHDVLDRLPREILVDNSRKSSPIQPHFTAFNDAPIDDARWANAEFSNACDVVSTCGMGLTPLGYYPCAVAGGIDRVLGAKLGVSKLPESSDDMLAAARELCRFCGRFREGHYVPRVLRPTLTEARVSKAWVEIYERWRERRMSKAKAAHPKQRTGSTKLV